MGTKQPFPLLSRFLFLPFSRSSPARSFRAISTFVTVMLFSSCVLLTWIRRYLSISHAWKTLLNYVFEDLRKTKVPNTVPVRGAPHNELYLSGAAPDYPVPLEDKTSNGRQRPNPNGWVMWLAHRTVSGGAPGCPVHPSTAAPPQRLFGGWGL
jgi:hypothetical protein